MPKDAAPRPAPFARLSRRRRLLLNLALLCVSVLLVLLIAEVALRIAAAFSRQHLETLRSHQRTDAKTKLNLVDIIRLSSNDRMVYELVPGVSGVLDGQEIHINAAGFRGPDRLLEKPEGVFRIAGIGDSNVFGWRLPLADTHGAILAAKLNELTGGERYQYLDFGVPGYNAIMMFEMLKTRAIRYHPDLVLMGQSVDDYYLPNFVAARPRPWSLDRSFLRQAIRDVIAPRTEHPPESLAKRGFSDVPVGEHGFKHFVPGRVPERYRDLYGPEAAARAFADAGKWCRERTLPLAQMFLLYYYPLHNKTGTYADIEQYAFLGAQGHQAGFRLIDPTPYCYGLMKKHGLLDRSTLLWVAPGDAHPNRLHNTMFARCALESLVNMSLIPDAAQLRPRLPQILAAWDAEIETELLRKAAQKR